MTLQSLVVAGFVVASLASQPVNAALSVGAARVDITPEKKALPKGYEGINDPIYIRAIVVDDGTTRAALVTVDAGGIPTDIYTQVSQQAERELRIPARHMLLTATHTHSVPFGVARELAPRIVAAISQAAGRLQPARMAYGTGVSYINVNRNIIDPKTHRWWEGPNYEGVSDKTVAVFIFAALDGRPIAVYYNYAVHAVLNGQLDQISGDIPGAASRYIEDSLDDQAVAVWSTGAAGDQNPIYFQQTYDLREIRIKEHALAASTSATPCHREGRASTSATPSREADESTATDGKLDGADARRGGVACHARECRAANDLGTDRRRAENR